MKRLPNIEELFKLSSLNSQDDFNKLKKDADSGNATKCIALGLIYLMGIGVEYDLKMAEHYFSSKNLANDERAIFLLGYIAECNNDIDKALNHYSRFSLSELSSSEIKANDVESIKQHAKQISDDLNTSLKIVFDNRLSLFQELGQLFKCPHNEVLTNLLKDFNQGKTSALTCMYIAFIVNKNHWYETASWALYNEGQLVLAKSCLLRCQKYVEAYPLKVLIDRGYNLIPALDNNIIVETGNSLIDYKHFYYLDYSSKDISKKMLQELKQWSLLISTHLTDNQYKKESDYFHQWLNQVVNEAKVSAREISLYEKKKSFKGKLWTTLPIMLVLYLLLAFYLYSEDHEPIVFIKSLVPILLLILGIGILERVINQEAQKKNIVATPFKNWDWLQYINMDEYVDWCANKTEKNNAEAQNVLAFCYIYGLGGLKQNLAIAVELFLKAAKSGNAEAQFCLGYLFENGVGTAQNEKEAFKWYKKSAEQGFADAQNNLGNLYYKNNTKEAIKLYELAADQGCVQAHNNLGNCYLKGLGVIQNKTIAQNYYKEANRLSNND